MDKIVCTVCKEEKDPDDFGNSSRNKDGKRHQCKVCRHKERYNWRMAYKKKHGEEPTAEYQRQHRKEAEIWRKRRVSETQEWINKIKESTPCTDCGGSFPAVCMDFDHLPEFTKDRGIAKMVQDGCTRAAIEREMMKCQIVCSNCHRIRTHLLRDRPWYEAARKDYE